MFNENKSITIKPFEKMNYGDSEVCINDCSIQYVQASDCTEDDGAQSITISSRNNGVGRFLNIKTGEEGWSFDNIESLKILIDDFLKRSLIQNDN